MEAANQKLHNVKPKKLIKKRRKKGGVYSNTKTSVQQYFSYYSKFINQQNMLQDSTRMNAYHNAIFNNKADFKGKVVMDLGTGSGILAIFAAQAGAQKVYAVEASNSADWAKLLISQNGLDQQIEVVKSTIEDYNNETLLKDKVDILISEPLGIMLFNERMLESYIIARDKYLKPGGIMFPSYAEFYAVPFYDEPLYCEIMQGAENFWKNNNFYGVDISGMLPLAKEERLEQPIIDGHNSKTNLSIEAKRMVDFRKIKVIDLSNLHFKFDFNISRVGVMHGVVFWFKAIFEGTQCIEELSTDPNSPITHWYQIKLLMKEQLGVNPGQKVKVKVNMTTNEFQSYDIIMKAKLLDIKKKVCSNKYDLRNPDYRGFYSCVKSYCNGR